MSEQRIDLKGLRVTYGPNGGWEDPQVLALVEAVEAARSVHAGLTCANDPMDVDERIERLADALAKFSFGTDDGRRR